MRLSVLAVFLLCATAAVADPPVAIRFGRLVDGEGRVTRDAVVVVEGERISKVGSGESAVPAGATVVDLRRFTGVPGLVDVHTHMTPGLYADIVAVEGDPLADVEALVGGVRWVMKGGRVVVDRTAVR